MFSAIVDESDDDDIESERKVFMHWASKANTGKFNVQNRSVMNGSQQSITKGRCLEGKVAAHNLCVVVCPKCEEELRKAYVGTKHDDAIVFAIGGEYRDPKDKRGNSLAFNGISLFGFRKIKKKYHLWSNFEFRLITTFLRGDHEGRSFSKQL